MSYRIYVNNYQILGNNDCPSILMEELKKQGCIMDEDCCFHNFELKDLNGFIVALELVIKQEVTGNHIDFDYILQRDNLTYDICRVVKDGYIFVTYNLLQYLKGYYNYEIKHLANGELKTIYTIKPGKHIYVSAF